ncbi:MAG: lysostaphin resistance A-like protein [Phycisphaerae bacterium]
MAEGPTHSEGPPAPPTVPDDVPIGVARGLGDAGRGRPADAMLLPEVHAGQAAMDVVVFSGLLLVSILVMGLVAGMVLVVWGDIDERWLQVAGLPVQGAVWVALVAAMLAFREQSAASIGVCGDRWAVDGLLGLVTWGVAIASWLLGIAAVWVFWRSGFEELQNNIQSIEAMLPRMHPVFIVALQFVVAVYEEVVFRGFLLTRLRKAVGSWWLAVPLSSALFAGPHIMNQVSAAVLPLFVLGCALSVMTIWRRSLIPAILGHALWNSGTLVYLYYTSPDWP